MAGHALAHGRQGFGLGGEAVQAALAEVVAGGEVGEAALPGELERIAALQAGGEPPQVFLRADRGLDYGRVMRVMGELNRAGLNRVALVTVEGPQR